MEDAWEDCQLFGSALSIASGGDDFRPGIRGVKFADGVARLRIRRSGYGTRVNHDDVGAIGSGGNIVALLAQLALYRRGIGLRGSAAELFDVECRHSR